MVIKEYGSNFIAIDVELANNDRSSICEIGIAKLRAGELVETWRVLVNPKSTYKELFHSNLHGIRHQHTSEAPTFPEVYSVLKRFMEERMCIFHGASNFDQVCIAMACERYKLHDITKDTEWVSTLDLARDYWPDEPNHKLENLCKKIHHSYLPHNALEDAIASAAVFRAIYGLAHVPAIAAAGTTKKKGGQIYLINKKYGEVANLCSRKRRIVSFIGYMEGQKINLSPCRSDHNFH